MFSTIKSSLGSTSKGKLPSSKFRALVLSGGGIKGFGHLGILHYYHTEGSLCLDPTNGLQEICGTSVGAMIGMLLVCGYTPQEIYLHLHQASVPISIGTKNIWDIPKGYGIIDISKPFAIIEEMVKEKLGYIPTLEKLYQLSHIVLKVSVVNISKMRVEYFDHRNNPELLVTEAVKMSCNLPIVFQKIVYNDNIYSDGGLADNFPFEGLDDKSGRILGCVSTTSYLDSYQEDSLVNYLYKIVILPIETTTNLRISFAKRLYPNIQIINILFKNIMPIDFGLDTNQRATIFKRGHGDAKAIESKTPLHVLDWMWDDAWGDNFELATSF